MVLVHQLPTLAAVVKADIRVYLAIQIRIVRQHCLRLACLLLARHVHLTVNACTDHAHPLLIHVSLQEKLAHRSPMAAAYARGMERAVIQMESLVLMLRHARL